MFGKGKCDPGIFSHAPFHPKPQAINLKQDFGAAHNSVHVIPGAGSGLLCESIDIL